MANMKTKCVHLAADAAQGEAIRDALIAQGIAARLVFVEDGRGGQVLEVHVPAEQAPRAGEVIARGRWPRLA